MSIASLYRNTSRDVPADTITSAGSAQIQEKLYVFPKEFYGSTFSPTKLRAFIAVMGEMSIKGAMLQIDIMIERGMVREEPDGTYTVIS